MLFILAFMTSLNDDHLQINRVQIKYFFMKVQIKESSQSYCVRTNSNCSKTAVTNLTYVIIGSEFDSVNIERSFEMNK